MSKRPNLQKSEWAVKWQNCNSALSAGAHVYSNWRSIFYATLNYLSDANKTMNLNDLIINYGIDYRYMAYYYGVKRVKKLTGKMGWTLTKGIADVFMCSNQSNATQISSFWKIKL